MKPSSHSPRAGDAAPLIIGREPLSIDDVCAVARGGRRAVLDADPEFRARLDASCRSLERQLRAGRTIYGVTTGVGESCETDVPVPLAETLALNLLRFHGCGTGAALSDEESAAVVAVRLASLSRGHSGVRPVVLERLVDLLAHRILPQIPSEGSVGASGDLTPLSYVAATLIGEREVSFRGQIVSAKTALEACGLRPLVLQPKESLALMNGTSMMTGLACLAFARARRLGRLAAALTAGASDVLRGNPSHFDQRIFDLKPHPGQAACARWIRDDIEYQPGVPRPQARIQDRYSIRCAPHVIGVLLDALAAFRGVIETEINSVNDNPIVDADSDEILHGGNFYGGHIAFAMDGLKTAAANVADLLDRQMAHLCNPMVNAGLPADLVWRQTGDKVTHHGFKAMQISTSALTAEALKLTMPASAFSRSTESHNQDKVSMGSIAARDCQRVLDLTETVAIIELLAVCQAVDLRDGDGCHVRARTLHQAVRAVVPRNEADRRQDGDIARLLQLYRDDALPIGAADFP
ncbi:MAG TPA: aromatic amino acid ammonia-lyase [Polyangia bacterium]|jgi:histidine ammonia-lyase|nr:aromatic amino acid ammonia-lyase [Polyangia bacterium]